MVKHAIRFAAFAAALVLVSGCKDDITAEKQAWETVTKDFSAKFDVLKKAHDELIARVRTYEVPAGNEGIIRAKAAMDGAAAAQLASVLAAEKALASAKATTEAAIAASKKAPLAAALEAARAALGASLSKVSEAQVATGRAFSELDAQVTQVRAAAQQAAAEAAAFAKWVQDTTRTRGAHADFPGIAFKAGTAELDAAKNESRADLEKLKTLARNCNELRATLEAVAVGEAKGLKAVATKRAEAVKAWLVANGADAREIVQATGSTAKEGQEKVTMTTVMGCQ